MNATVYRARAGKLSISKTPNRGLRYNRCSWAFTMIGFAICWAFCFVPLFVLGAANEDRWWNAIPTAMFGSFFAAVVLYNLGE